MLTRYLRRLGRTTLLFLISTTGLWAATDAGVDSELPSYHPQTSLHGRLLAAGDDDMEGVFRRWTSLYEKLQPGVKIELQVDSSATAGRALAAGATIAFVGRKFLDPEVVPVIAAWGFAPFPVVVAGGSFDDRDKTHAEMVWVNARNPLRSISLEQLRGVFGESDSSGQDSAITWGDLGMSGEWTRQPIHAFRHKSVGVTQFISDEVLKGRNWSQAVTLLDKAKDVPGRISADPYSIGLAGKGFVTTEEIRALAIVPTSGGAAVEPTRDNVAAFRYPLTRVIYVYVKKAPRQLPDAVTGDFLRLILSRGGQEAALREGFLPLPAARATLQLASLNSLEAKPPSSAESPGISGNANRVAAQFLVPVDKSHAGQHRALAMLAYHFYQKDDIPAAATIARILECEWDRVEGELRTRDPALWSEIDEAMDDFVRPLIATEDKPDARKLKSAYEKFLTALEKLRD